MSTQIEDKTVKKVASVSVILQLLFIIATAPHHYMNEGLFLVLFAAAIMLSFVHLLQRHRTNALAGIIKGLWLSYFLCFLVEFFALIPSLIIELCCQK